MISRQKKEDYDFLYKIILVGDSNVGKTSFLIRYTKQVITKQPAPTIGLEYVSKSYLLKNGEGIVKAQIWDTSGSEKYKSITTAHYRKSVGAIMFYDLTNKESYDNLIDWFHEIQNNSDEGIIVMVIGNKLDLIEKDPSIRKIPAQEVEDLCKKYNFIYQETSAKFGLNVKESFELLIETIYQEQQKNNIEEEVQQKQTMTLKVDNKIDERKAENEESKTLEQKEMEQQNQQFQESSQQLNQTTIKKEVKLCCNN